MSDIKQHVFAVQSGGGGCAICDDQISAGEYVVMVRFVVPAIFVNLPIEREMHTRCAVALQRGLAMVVKVAQRAEKGR